ncbi:LysR family transcriptional regulator [Rhizobium rhizogenes]|jgi:LysR family cyn operon transcriptional activator|uniref:LysR family transcriptional regulator n=1 Tax=Rhizobium rhizogenes TaxID=359 RepID=UPI0022C39245|nr:LysR family transcriptional regulator [Rhizobium rhizogenes]MCZ7463989.1 LysR family transcriptional regulator [Rhizobium rhizogenes]
MVNPTIAPAMLRRLRRLSLRQLIYFMELERYGGFSRAAQALAISQPTLSQQISQLEEELGVKLIDRTTRRFVLTDEGRELQIRLRRIMKQLGDAVSEVSSHHKGEALSIGIPNYTTYPVISETLRRFIAAISGAMPRLIEVPAEEMSQLLNDGELDAGFMTVPTPVRLSPRMASLVAWEAPLLFCLQKTHPFASLPALSPEHVATLDIVLVPRDYHRAHYDHQLGCLRSLGIEPRLIETDVTNIQSQMALTSAGIGVCLLSADTALLPPDLVLKPSLPELGRHQLLLFWADDNINPQLRQFRRCVIDA